MEILLCHLAGQPFLSYKELLSVVLRMERMKTLFTRSWTQILTMMWKEESGPCTIPFMVKLKW